jgi:hypothetical protein
VGRMGVGRGIVDGGGGCEKRMVTRDIAFVTQLGRERI